MEIWVRLLNEPKKNLNPVQDDTTYSDKYAENEVWHSSIRVNHDRISALNGRYLCEALQQASVIPPNAPALTQVRISVVRSAANTINALEDLLVLGSLKFCHSFV
jgi:hypothetical protein